MRGLEGLPQCLGRQAELGPPQGHCASAGEEAGPLRRRVGGQSTDPRAVLSQVLSI